MSVNKSTIITNDKEINNEMKDNIINSNLNKTTIILDKNNIDNINIQKKEVPENN